ncbi:MAG: hypothetical protein ACI35T_04690 [Alistipes sp.]
MKRLVAILGILSLFAGTCYGQKEKVVERSNSRAPEWLGISDADRFSVSATAETLDAAQQGCLNEIKQHIATSIAVNITSKELFGQDALVRDNVTAMLTRYSSQVETHSADMPYLCGISLSKATAIYWERRFVKQQKRYYYICHVQYPFTESERRASIDDFLRIDRRHEEKLAELQRNYHTFTDLSYIGEAVSELDALFGYFFDANRRRSAKTLRDKYIRARQEVAVVPDTSSIGAFRYHLSLQGRHVATATKPALKSDYATNLRVMPSGEGYILLYDEMEIEGEENTIQIAYPFGKEAHYTVIFDPTEGKVRVRPYGTIVVTSTDEPKMGQSRLRIDIPLRSRTDSEFEIERVEMSIADTSVSATPSAGANRFHGKGEHLLTIEAKLAAQPTEGFLAEGFIRIRNPHNGISTDSKFTLPYKINH